MKKRYSDISRYFFLILFLGFFGSNTFFDHTHLYGENIVVHSHPFKKDPNGKPIHSHNNSAYQLIYLLNTYIASIVFSFSLTLLVFLLSEDIITRITIGFRSRIDRSFILLRGPPNWMFN